MVNFCLGECRDPPGKIFEILDCYRRALAHSGMLKWFGNACVFRSQSQFVKITFTVQLIPGTFSGAPLALESIYRASLPHH